MPRSLIRTRSPGSGFKRRLVAFFKSPLNDASISALVIGLFLLSVSGTMHPVAVTKLTQESQYPVTQNVSSNPSFSLFPNKVTFVAFQMPEGQKVNYSLSTLVELHINPTLANPGGIKLVLQTIANGEAINGTVVQIQPQKIAFSVQTVFSLYSLSGSQFNITVVSYAFYNSTQSFSPPYAISGLALTLVSITILASLAGIKVEEI